MPLLSDQAQENLTSFIEEGLEMADDFLQDAVVHLQLREFFWATESLRDAIQSVNLVAGYFPNVAESAKLAEYAANVSTTRQRVDVLEQSILREGTNNSP